VLPHIVAIAKVLAKNELYSDDLWSPFKQLVGQIKTTPKLARELDYIRYAFEADTKKPLIDSDPIGAWLL
jgi:hypothetical protein